MSPVKLNFPIAFPQQSTVVKSYPRFSECLDSLGTEYSLAAPSFRLIPLGFA